MPTLVVNGREIEVGDNFLSLPPDQQGAAVDHIAKSMAPVWSGSILPVSKDATGAVSFDPDAGILGAVKGAVSVPGDVFMGKTPTHLPNGQPNPELLRRAFDLSGIATPIGAAGRAGVGWAGVPEATRRAAVVPPTAQALKDAAGAGYTAARESGLEMTAPAVADMARTLQTGLEQDGIIAELAPKTFSILGKITNPPEGAVATVANLEAIRRSFGEALRSAGPDAATDRKAAGTAIRAIDSFLETLNPTSVVAGTATPEGVAAVANTLRGARGNYAAAQRSNDLTGELDRAVTGITERAENRAQAANSGRNFDNALRQRVASMLERPKDVMGYSDAEIAALNEVLQGGPVRNASRLVGNLLGGGMGWGGAATSAIGGATGAAAGGGLGAAIGAAAPIAVGTAAKTLENALARRSMRKADAVVRQNSPLAREAAAQAPTLPTISAREAAVLRALLPGLISPQQPRPSVYGNLGVI